MKITSVDFIKSAREPSQYPKSSLPEVAFAGRSNVGKSSLINTLVNRKRFARTSTTPGRTRLINFFMINNRVCFVDLPGYGYARVPLSVKRDWGPMVEKYLRERENLRLVILILDVRRDPSEGDLSLLEWLHFYRINVLVILTKIDKLSRNQIKIRQQCIKKILELSLDSNIILFSARTGEGKGAIWKEIEKSSKQ
ncbi:MAG: ribosome biogenesis GTP-binding protein YihA/YsxC [Thermodesulfobacteriota bacterium]|nr:ribosome biogenesis GTP-binding protein YihA/YsxC [Thermodesulfobacteriota bacterium]